MAVGIVGLGVNEDVDGAVVFDGVGVDEVAGGNVDIADIVGRVVVVAVVVCIELVCIVENEVTIDDASRPPRSPTARLHIPISRMPLDDIRPQNSRESHSARDSQ